MEHLKVPRRIYRFGPFELVVDAGELLKNGVRLKLQDQPFQILCALLDHSGELVSRERLRQQLWPEGTFVDFEHGLNTAVKKLRDVLGDDPDNPRYIETVPRKGYRFLAPLNRDGVPVIPAELAPRRHLWQSRTPILIGGLVIVMVITAVLFREISYEPYLRISATRQLTFTGEVSIYPTIETDGRRVYYAKYDDGHLYSVPVSGGTESSYPTRFAALQILHISPDGSALLVKDLFGSSGGHVSRIWLLPTNGGPARPLGDVEGEIAAWSPDGKTIAFEQRNAIYTTEDQGATYHLLVRTPGVPWWIRWSPDGQRLRFTLEDPKTLISSIWETPFKGKPNPVELRLGGSREASRGIWTRDGRHFLFRQVRDQRADYWVTGEHWSLFRSSKPFPLGSGGVEMTSATASPLENTLFAVGNQASRMTFKFDPAGRQLVPFLPKLSVQNPAFSSDGKWMVLDQVQTRESVLWRARSDGSEWLQLTDPKMEVIHGRFSPDGKRIALMAKWPDRPWKIYWVSAAGGALHEINVPIANQADPNWMPNGQSILFGQPPRYLAEPDTPRAIYVHDLQTNSISKIPGSEGWFSPRISPDSNNFLALSSDEHKLAVYDFANSRWRVLVENPQERLGCPSWSPDGDSAYVTVYGKSVLRIRIRDGVTEKVLSFREMIASPQCWAWNVAADGSLLISCIRPNSNIYALRYE